MGSTARALVAVAVLGTGLGLGVSGTWPFPRSDGIAFGAPPVAYVVMYRNDVNGAPQWEVLSAQRPFDGSDLTYRTPARPGPDALADAGTISTRTELYTENSSGVHLVSGRQPGPASADLWLQVEMRDAIARGLAQDRHETRAIAGFRCAVYRMADPPSGPLHPLNDAVGHDDLCIARNGLVLSETWTYHGSVVEQRTAVSVTIGSSWPASLPRPGAVTGADKSGGVGAVLTADAHPAASLATPPTPAGFRPAGDPVDFRLPDPQDPAATVAATTVWSFAAGVRVITVEAGRQRSGMLPWDPADTVTRAVRLAGLGPATTALRSDGPEVRVDLGGGQWVRVRGTVSLASLTAYAERLRRA